MRNVFTIAVCIVLTISANAQTSFFPPGTFGEQSFQKARNARYSCYLRAMEEPSLWELSKTKSLETYRFLWLRSFHQPVSARLELASDGSGELSVRALRGAGGQGSPGQVTEWRDVRVSKDDVNHFLELLGKSDFWNAPAEEGVTATEKLADGTTLLRLPPVDGAQWIVEGVKAGQYHVMDRWSPKDGAYREAGLFLAIKLGGLEIPEREIY